MKRAVLSLLPFLLGCATIQQSESPVELPSLVRSSPLPTIVSSFHGGGLRLSVSVFVLTDGTVGDVRLLDSSGDSDWDRVALDSIRHWEFTPARRNSEPVALWIHQPLLIQIREPIMRYLGELVCATQREADSLYALMLGGEEFDSVVRRSGVVGSAVLRSRKGPVDITVFAPTLRAEIQNLKENELTRPLRYGDRFAIFKRILI